MSLFLPHRRKIWVVSSHPHRPGPNGTPSFYCTYNPVIPDRRHGNGFSRKWQENITHWPHFTSPGRLDFLIHLFYYDRVANRLEKSSSHACPKKMKSLPNLSNDKKNHPLLRRISLNVRHLCVFIEKLISLFCPKCVSQNCHRGFVDTLKGVINHINNSCCHRVAARQQQQQVGNTKAHVHDLNNI